MTVLQTNPAATRAEDQIPLRLSDPAQFAFIREFFERVGFSEARVYPALGIQAPVDVTGLDWSKVDMDAIPPDLRWCIQVFIGGAATPVSEAYEACGADVLIAMEELGLIHGANELVWSPVWLYPLDGLVVASDRHQLPDGTDIEASSDVIFPAVHVGTLTLLKLIPQMEQGDVLDIGGGTGIIAMHAARLGNRAVSTDITLRALVFATFNSRLNDVPIECLRGDMYEPVSGRQFDLITMHVPYVPSASGSKVFADGGETGEELTRRVVEGLPAYLRPGGMAALICAGRDTNDVLFEGRVKDWLGSHAEWFDVIMGVEAFMSLDDLAEALRRSAPEDEVRATVQRLSALGTKHYAYGLLMLRRCEERVTNRAGRVTVAHDVTPADFMRLFAWRERCRRVGFEEWLAQLAPRPAAGAELTVRHMVEGGRLIAKQHTFTTNHPFQAALGLDGTVIPLIARLDGSHTVTEVFEAARTAGELPERSHLAMFLALVSLLIERGLLVI